MDERLECFPPDINGSQTECSWIPNTPAKPGIAKKHPICEDKLENQSFFTNWLSLGPTPQPTQADTTDCLVSGAESVCRNVSLVYPDFYNKRLMLLTDAETSAAPGHRDVHVVKTYNASVLHYQEARSTHATLQTESLYSSWANEISILPESRHEGNRSAVNEDPSLQSSVHLAPITPNLSKESNKEGFAGTNLCLDDATNKIEDCIVKEAYDDITDKQVAHDSCELQKDGQSEPPDHISCPTVSKTLQENHEPDMGSNQHVYLKTPQRKPKRKKHRPKVISSNQPKLNSRTTKPAQSEKSTPTKRKHARNNTVSTQGNTALNGRTGTDPGAEDTRKPKRMRVKRNGINQQASTPLEEDITGTTSTKTNHTTRKSCRRSLNFDSGKSQGSPCQPLSNPSTRNLGKGLDDSDLTKTPIKCLEVHLSTEEIKTSCPSTPLEYGQLIPGSSNVCLSRKCPIVFSSTTPYDQCDARNSNTSDCRSILTYERKAQGRKRGRLSSNDKSNFCSVNAIWAECSYIRQPIEFYENLQTLQFPAICKKKRAQRIHKRTTFWMLRCVQNNVFYYNNHFRGTSILSSGFKTIQVHCNARSSQSRISTVGNAQLHQNILNYTSFLGIPKPLKKRRSKGLTRPRDLASLSWCTSLADGFSRQLALQKVRNAQESQMCSEALVAATLPILPRKKRSKIYVLGFPAAMASESLLSVDAVIQQFSRLDIAAKGNTLANVEMNALVAYHYEHPRRNILVNRIGWTMISFDALNDHSSQRRARPKVDIDEETTRVWKLLLEDINNEGVDGTDEEKRKKWHEEREIFCGRANSFIAKMRLVQGDRRFCPWKGSVVDSVVGVFLTQNVSDHLSSSAFMSMAAKFPLKTSSNSKSSYEGFIEKVNQWNLENLSVDYSAAVLSTKHNLTDTHDFFKFPYEDINSTENLRSISSESSEFGPSMLTEIKISEFDAFTVDGVIHLNHLYECQRPLDDVLSSKNSIDSSGQSIKKNQLLCTNNVLDEKSSKHCTGTSFVHLLQMQEKTNFGSTDVSPVILTLTESEAIEDSRKSKTLDAKQNSNDTTTELTRASAESEGNMNDFGKISVEVETIQPERMAVKSDANIYRPKTRRGKSVKSKQKVDWDNLRKEAHATCKRDRMANTMDSVDWETVRCTEVGEIAETIKDRGMNNMLAERIKDFLNRLIRDHGSIDLEWLRDVPPDKAKEYLLSIRGLGLKSVECVRLLTLHHVAFPVDTNVGRIAVRLGWVPLQPLPESLQLHLLELYPVLESIQKYLWPRLCKLNQRKLYELHYQMITFGKVFCTKNKPNCNACPMRGECRHFASAYASARLALPRPADKSIVTTNEYEKVYTSQAENIHHLQLPKPEPSQQLSAPSLLTLSHITIEVPADSKPIIEEPDSPEPEHITPEPEPGNEEFETESEFTKFSVDMEDIFQENDDEIPTIDLNIEALNQNLQNIIQNRVGLRDSEYSKALVVLNPEAASIPVPKLKNINRLRTEHQVYVIPDSHELLNGLGRREINDPSPYLLAIWSPGETIDTVQPLERRCKIKESDQLCHEDTCFACNSIREDASQTVRGTILIPCRTAMRGSFPLNGTYFQVNEVFADHESSLNPINVPRDWLWNLRRRTVYFGTSIPTIFKGLGPREIQHCFWRGFVCVRGFDRVTRGPRPLIARLHFPASKLANYREAAES